MKNQNPEDILKNEIIFAGISRKNKHYRSANKRKVDLRYFRRNNIGPIDLKEKTKIINLDALKETTMLYYKIKTHVLYTFNATQVKTENGIGTYKGISVKAEKNTDIYAIEFTDVNQKKQTLETGLLQHLVDHSINKNTLPNDFYHHFIFLIREDKKHLMYWKYKYHVYFFNSTSNTNYLYANSSSLFNIIRT